MTPTSRVSSDSNALNYNSSKSTRSALGQLKEGVTEFLRRKIHWQSNSELSSPPPVHSHSLLPSSKLSPLHINNNNPQHKIHNGLHGHNNNNNASVAMSSLEFAKTSQRGRSTRARQVQGRGQPGRTRLADFVETKYVHLAEMSAVAASDNCMDMRSWELGGRRQRSSRTRSRESGTAKEGRPLESLTPNPPPPPPSSLNDGQKEGTRGREFGEFSYGDQGEWNEVSKTNLLGLRMEKGAEWNCGGGGGRMVESRGGEGMMMSHYSTHPEELQQRVIRLAAKISETRIPMLSSSCSFPVSMTGAAEDPEPSSSSSSREESLGIPSADRISREHNVIYSTDGETSLGLQQQQQQQQAKHYNLMDEIEEEKEKVLPILSVQSPRLQLDITDGGFPSEAQVVSPHLNTTHQSCSQQLPAQSSPPGPAPVSKLEAKVDKEGETEEEVIKQLIKELQRKRWNSHGVKKQEPQQSTTSAKSAFPAQQFSESPGHSLEILTDNLWNPLKSSLAPNTDKSQGQAEKPQHDLPQTRIHSHDRVPPERKSSRPVEKMDCLDEYMRLSARNVWGGGGGGGEGMVTEPPKFSPAGPVRLTVIPQPPPHVGTLYKDKPETFDLPPMKVGPKVTCLSKDRNGDGDPQNYSYHHHHRNELGSLITVSPLALTRGLEEKEDVEEEEEVESKWGLAVDPLMKLRTTLAKKDRGPFWRIDVFEKSRAKNKRRNGVHAITFGIKLRRSAVPNTRRNIQLVNLFPGKRWRKKFYNSQNNYLKNDSLDDLIIKDYLQGSFHPTPSPSPTPITSNHPPTTLYNQIPNHLNDSAVLSPSIGITTSHTYGHNNNKGHLSHGVESFLSRDGDAVVSRENRTPKQLRSTSRTPQPILQLSVESTESPHPYKNKAGTKYSSLTKNGHKTILNKIAVAPILEDSSKISSRTKTLLEAALANSNPPSFQLPPHLSHTKSSPTNSNEIPLFNEEILAKIYTPKTEFTRQFASLLPSSRHS